MRLVVAWSGLVVGLAVAGCRGANAEEVANDGAVIAPRCAATTTTLVDPKDFLGAGKGPPSVLSSALDVAVSGSDVFYVVHSGQEATIMRVSTAGGAPSLVATVPGDPVSPERIVATPGAVFYQWTSYPGDGGTSRSLLSVSPTGGTPDTIARVDDFVAPDNWFVTDTRYLYFVDDLGTERMPLAGGAIQMISDHRGDLALVGDEVVIADGNTGNVNAVPVGGGSSTLLGQWGTNATQLVACGDDVCWTTGGQATPSGSSSFTPADGGLPVAVCGPLGEGCQYGSLVRLHAGTQPVTVFTSRDFSASEVVFDGTDFYMSQIADASPGAIFKMTAAGGPPSFLEAGIGFAVDDSCLYWANADGVFSIAKSALSSTPGPEAGTSSSCVLGDVGPASCDIGLGCAVPDAGLAGCAVCAGADGAPVDCRAPGQGVACGPIACGVGCSCAAFDAGVCACVSP